MNKFHIISVLLMLNIAVSSFQLQAQVPGNGLEFDGYNDYVTLPSAPSDELNPSEFLTIECWVKLNEALSVSHRPHLISKFASYALAVESNGYATVFVYTGDWYFTQSLTPITTDKWYHLAGTYDGTTLRIYVNGVMENSIPLSLPLSQNISPVRIGALSDTVNNTNTSGIIEEARIWNITRTQAEIQGSMNRTIPGSTSGLVGYWRFDESSGTNADCETAFDNDGTLTNMSVPSAWTTSTASLGDNSIFGVSANLAETAGCAVDVNFRAAPEGPGTGYSMAVMQVNQPPNSTSGLLANRATRYWEIWSEDPDFDGDFTADVRFHYDNISGFNNEISLKLFRRDDANDTWSAVTGYTVVTNDGGSSTTGDGMGYVELTVTESTPGDFSGQYILSWRNNAPPVVTNIPDQSVPEGTAFTTIALDDYVSDPDNADSEITWTFSGEDNVTVVITNRVATITANDPDWNGTDMVTFTATDTEGESDSDAATFEVTAVNDPPVVSDIPDQTIAEGASFATIDLDNFVTDIDNTIASMTWTSTGASNLSVDITGRVATITVKDEDWNGSETITFQAEDPDEGTDSDQATFTVTSVNDPPVVSDISNQTIAEGASFATIDLDDMVEDVDDPDSLIIWEVQGNNNITVTMTDRIVQITPDDPDWNGSDTLIFVATDTSGASDTDTSIFMVTPVNDAPVLVRAIPDTSAEPGKTFSFILDSYIFTDVDPGDSLVYSASMTKGGSTPPWIAFDPATGTFSGTPAEGDTGTVEVIVTATDDSLASAADTFHIEVGYHTGILNSLSGLEISLYPNPNNGRFVIESDRFEGKHVVMEILNEKGQLIWNREINDETGILRESVELDKVADGLYLLRLRTKSGMINKRFIISR